MDVVIWTLSIIAWVCIILVGIARYAAIYFIDMFNGTRDLIVLRGGEYIVVNDGYRELLSSKEKHRERFHGKQVRYGDDVLFWPEGNCMRCFCSYEGRVSTYLFPVAEYEYLAVLVEGCDNPGFTTERWIRLTDSIGRTIRNLDSFVSKPTAPFLTTHEIAPPNDDFDGDAMSMEFNRETGSFENLKTVKADIPCRECEFSPDSLIWKDGDVIQLTKEPDLNLTHLGTIGDY